MAKRKQPFGYCMRDGQIQIMNHEAEIVRVVFTSHAEGNSYKTLTDMLNGQDVPYFPGKPWNKNMVARILQDKRYRGDNSYPAIIAEEPSHVKPDACGKPRYPQIREIRILARCAQCGSHVRRERQDTWRCPCCTASSIRSSDRKLMNSVAALVQGLCGKPDSVTAPPPSDTENKVVLDAKDLFDQELDKPEFDESAAKAKAIALAATRFDALDSEDYETTRIQYILSKTEQNGELDAGLLRQITSAILIHPSGMVSLQLKNGQIIRRSDLT